MSCTGTQFYVYFVCTSYYKGALALSYRCAVHGPNGRWNIVIGT